MSADKPLASILIVDDDEDLSDMMASYLRTNGYEVMQALAGRFMRNLLAEHCIDLIVLDLMLPEEDGLSLLRWLREHHGPPVIIVSARGDEVDRVIGLEMGADDYLPKPFGPRELLARVRVVLRRNISSSVEHTPENPCFGPFQLNLLQQALFLNGQEIPLTHGEFCLLQVFLAHPHQVLSRDRLIGLLKGYERSPYDRSIDIRVTRLRRKIEPKPETPIYLRTIWGAGYLFAP